MRPTYAEIDLEALSHNLTEVRRMIGNREILAVVKASAYGHGAIPVARRLESDGVEAFGVAILEEGIELRKAEISKPIIILTGVNRDEVESAIHHNLTPVVYNLDSARHISEISNRLGRKTDIHIKVDTGMGRLGFRVDEAVDAILRISRFNSINIEGLLTHFADADLADKEYANLQVKLFREVVDILSKYGIDIPLHHAANSAAIIDYEPALFNMVRPGIMLYGYFPSNEVRRRVDLKPVLSLKSKVIFLKRVPTGTSISYGRTFITKRESLIAGIPLGYADGYNRLLSNNGEVLIRGKRAPIAGRICMDMFMVDVTDIDGVKEGDEVVLIGKHGNEQITADDIAQRTGTISYEVLCSISYRVPRVYINAQNPDIKTSKELKANELK
ncbi:MAG: alanine racemase [Nitrospirota bacterium]